MPVTLVWLALGAFCFGTEMFMIAPLLPGLAADLGVSVATAGQLVTVSALTYAIGSPILSTLTGSHDRKSLLVVTMLAFAAAAGLAAITGSFAQLLGAKILLALAAGLFMPSANTVGAMLVSPEKRARAIAAITGGLTVAVAFGVPLGAWIGSFSTWRTAYALVGVASLVALGGLMLGLPRNLPRGSASLSQRIAVAGRPEILAALLVTLLWATAAFSIYTYITPLAVRIGGDHAFVMILLLAFGIAAAFGNALGGWSSDRVGPVRTMAVALAVLTLADMASSAAVLLGASLAAKTVLVAAMMTWGVAGWAFHPAQSARLVSLAPDSAVVALSLNASAMYLGSAAGAALGALTISVGSVADLGWVGAGYRLAGLAVLVLAVRLAEARLRPQPGE
jgi:predicted MFS family arabinose efflux permease